MKYLILFLLFLLFSCSFKSENNKALSEIVKNDPGNSYAFGKISSTDSHPNKVLKFLNESDNNSKELPIPSLTGDSSFSIISNTGCSKSLINGSVCQVRISFNPQNKPAGIYKAQLKLGEYSLPEEISAEIPDLSNPYINFYNESQNQLTSPLDLGIAKSGINSFILFIKNEGTVPMINSALISNSVDFSYINECINKTLDPTTYCKITINFDETNKPSGQVFSTLISFGGKELNFQIKTPEKLIVPDNIQLLESDLEIQSIDLGILKKKDVSTKVYSFKNINNQPSNKGSAVIENTTDFTLLNQCLDRVLQPNEKCDIRLIFSGGGKQGIYTTKINFLNKEVIVKVEVLPENPTP